VGRRLLVLRSARSLLLDGSLFVCLFVCVGLLVLGWMRSYNTATGEAVTESISLGGLGDSFYEYLLKVTSSGCASQ
jgi:hypothetical protein